MITGLSTALSTKCSNVMFFTIPRPTPEPAQHLMRAPFSAFDIRTFLSKAESNEKKKGSGPDQIRNGKRKETNK